MDFEELFGHFRLISDPEHVADAEIAYASVMYNNRMHGPITDAEIAFEEAEYGAWEEQWDVEEDHIASAEHDYWVIEDRMYDEEDLSFEMNSYWNAITDR